MNRALWISLVAGTGLAVACGCTGVVGGNPKIEAPLASAQGDALPVTQVADQGDAAPEVICDRLVDDFSAGSIGDFPRAWETRFESNMPLARRQFSVVESDGRRALKAKYSQQLVTLGRGVENWDLSRYPILSWEWKALRLPTGAAETQSSKDDSVASVTAVWMIGFPFMVRQIEYAWSSSLAVGTRASNRLGHDQLVILQSGSSSEWRTERVNILEHQMRFFDLRAHEAQAPAGIAVISDADDTESEAEALYTNFRLCRLTNSPPSETKP